jgi:hypothetical protein
VTPTSQIPETLALTSFDEYPKAYFGLAIIARAW